MVVMLIPSTIASVNNTAQNFLYFFIAFLPFFGFPPFYFVSFFFLYKISAAAIISSIPPIVYQ